MKLWNVDLKASFFLLMCTAKWITLNTLIMVKHINNFYLTPTMHSGKMGQPAQQNGLNLVSSSRGTLNCSLNDGNSKMMITRKWLMFLSYIATASLVYFLIPALSSLDFPGTDVLDMFAHYEYTFILTSAHLFWYNFPSR